MFLFIDEKKAENIASASRLTAVIICLSLISRTKNIQNIPEKKRDAGKQ